MAKIVNPRAAKLNEKIERISTRLASQRTRLKTAKKAENASRVKRLTAKIANSVESLKAAKKRLNTVLKAA